MSRKNNAFTLVEILIVVIILGILAAVIIPQFTSASNDARESALSSDLQTVRSQLELYKVQHLDAYPAAATFVNQLTKRTDLNGNVDDGSGASKFPLGPYLQKFPTNGFVASSSVNNTVTSGASTVPGNDASGWYWDTTLNKFSPNDSKSNSNNVAHTGL